MHAFYDYFWDFVQDNLPYSVYDALYSFSGHLSTVFNGLNKAFTWAYKSASGTQEIERLSITEQIIPPLLSMVAIYFGLISLYRTTTSFIRTTVSIVKWVIIITTLATAAGYFAARGPVDTGTLLKFASMVTNGVQQQRAMAQADRVATPPRPGRTRGQRDEREGRRPSFLEPFINHEEWKNGQVQVEDAQEYVKRVVDGAQKVYKDGSGFLDLLFKRGSIDNMDEDEYLDDEDAPRRPRTRAQTRRTRRTRA